MLRDKHIFCNRGNNSSSAKIGEAESELAFHFGVRGSVLSNQLFVFGLGRFRVSNVELSLGRGHAPISILIPS